MKSALDWQAAHGNGGEHLVGIPVATMHTTII